MLCRFMGWTYDDVRTLPREVYGVLVEMVKAQSD